MINDQNIIDKIIKLLKEYTRVNIHELGFYTGFLNMTLKARTTQEKKYINWTL